MTTDDINKILEELLTSGDTRADSIIEDIEKEVISHFKTALEEIKKQIARMYEKFGENVDFADMASYNRLTNLEKQIAQILKELTGKTHYTMTNRFKDLFKEKYYYSGYSLETSVKVKLGFGLLDANKVKASLINPLDRISWPERLKLHTQTLLNQIKTEITQGLIQGRGYVKTARILTKKAGITAGKAVRIVRTESHRIQNAARIAAFDDSEAAAQRLGITFERVWIATTDGKTRSDHGALDGVAAEMIDGSYQWTFPNGIKTRGPGLSGVAEQDINCRCGTIGRVAGLQGKFRKDNISKQLIPNQSYEEWSKGLKAT